MKPKHVAVITFVILMILGGAWAGSGSPGELLAGLWASSAEALDMRANRAAIACAFIAGGCLVVGLLCLRSLMRLERWANPNSGGRK
ncbi:MAG: hypothetical protein ABFE07_28980 [Armatimonadia bacterium]